MGKRPDFAVSNRSVTNAARQPDGVSSTSGSTESEGITWAKLISAETLEDEVKSLQKQISETVNTPAKFKGGGFKASRKQFSELALLFAIVAKYDGEVRWKEKASGMRDLMGRAGHNCKVGTDASFSEAKLRKEDLELLVQGGNVSVPDGESEANWEKISDRAPLMQRLEQAQQQGIAPWTANSGEFSRKSADILHEAELIAAFAEAIQQPGYEFADDESYLAFARQMQDAAREVVGAVKGKNYEAARAASGNIEKSCSGCHEGFRS